MSQFVLCKGAIPEGILNQIEIIHYPFHEDEYLMNACNYFFHGIERGTTWYMCDKNSNVIDDLFLDAEASILSGHSFSNTDLFDILTIMLETVEEIIIWYADYQEDLPVASTQQELFEMIEEQIRIPSYEVYARYGK